MQFDLHVSRSPFTRTVNWPQKYPVLADYLYIAANQ